MRGGRRTTGWLAALTLAAALPASAEPESLEAVLAKCRQALGGEAAWAAIETRIEHGTHSTFSSEKPFVLERKRPALYRFDHQQADMKVVVGYDGENAWWENQTPFAEVEWPSTVPEAYRRGIEADARFAPPCFAADDATVELRGRTRYEGMDAIELEVTLANGLVEKWYLDPESHLPLARLSRAGFKDFEAENRVFYSDYRPVDGILLPHHVESEVDNLVSITVIETVELNAPLADSRFSLPLDPVSRKLLGLAGTWRVEVESRLLPMLPWTRDETVSTLRPIFDGRVLEEDLTYLFAGQRRRLRRLYTFDRFRQVVRLVQIDDLTAHPNVLEGDPAVEPLAVDNLSTGTAWRVRGQSVHDRLVIRVTGPASFEIDAERSLDEGRSWMVVSRFRYTRNLSS